MDRVIKMNTLYWVSYDEYFTPVSADSYADKMKYMSTNFNDAKQRYPRIYQIKVQQHSYHTSAYYSCFLTKKQTNEKQKKEQNHFWHQQECQSHAPPPVTCWIHVYIFWLPFESSTNCFTVKWLKVSVFDQPEGKFLYSKENKLLTDCTVLYWLLMSTQCESKFKAVLTHWPTVPFYLLANSSIPLNSQKIYFTQ